MQEIRVIHQEVGRVRRRSRDHSRLRRYLLVQRQPHRRSRTLLNKHNVRVGREQPRPEGSAAEPGHQLITLKGVPCISRIRIHRPPQDIVSDAPTPQTPGVLAGRTRHADPVVEVCTAHIEHQPVRGAPFKVDVPLARERQRPGMRLQTEVNNGENRIGQSPETSARRPARVGVNAHSQRRRVKTC